MAKPTDADKLNALLLAGASRPSVITHIAKLLDEDIDNEIRDHIVTSIHYATIQSHL